MQNLYPFFLHKLTVITPRMLFVLCLLVGFSIPAFSAEDDKPFNGTELPSESYLEENTVKKPSTRMAAPDEDGDGFDQKVPLGTVDYVIFSSLLGLSVFYIQRKTKKQ